MGELIKGIKDNWLKWGSVPYVFAILVMFYIGLATEVNDLPGVNFLGSSYLMLAIPFAIVFLGYVIWCAIDNRKEKMAAPAHTHTDEETPAEKKKKNPGILMVGILLALVSMVVAVIVFSSNSAPRDGKYVIWADQYHVSLTPTVVNQYYLVGDSVQAKGGELTDYTEHSVVELDFDKDGTFTITVDGKLLGCVPGKNGIGSREDCTCDEWVLEEAEDGIYYIKNTANNTYLKWFALQNNWTTHPNIVDDNRSQYLLRLTPVK